MVLLTLAFGIRGIFRGLVRQCFAFAGVLGGIWTALVLSRWVGAHWLGAQPAVVFVVLRWVVSGLAALAVCSLVTWWGEAISGAVQKSPVAWLDHTSGFFVGASMGAIVAAFILLIALSLPWPREAGAWAGSARVSRPLLSGAVRVCDMGNRFVPAGAWLKAHFLTAERRARAVGNPS